ncbi:MAG: ATP-dependent Clp protease adaptor ClpS [Lachnospiraceae bacterium]|nr:ATP-dependent Clp protease adaptor ClpS [Lachnospiraceae bacterium]
MAGQIKYEESTQIKFKVKEPKMYHVIMYNDDFTPMDFVVEILMSVFHKSETEAFQLMYAIHRGIKAVVGTYIYDIAVTKADEAVKRARAEGYPFRVETEPVEQ